MGFFEHLKHVKITANKNIYNFTLKNFVYLNPCLPKIEFDVRLRFLLWYQDSKD